MSDRILWVSLEELPDQEAAWREWHSCLTGWYRFNTFFNHYLRIKYYRAKLLKCNKLCDNNCPRQIIEESPSNITAVCPQKKHAPVNLKFRDILIYSLRRDALHQAICVALKILPTEYKIHDSENTWHLGDYYDASNKIYFPVYLTYSKSTLPGIISSLSQQHKESFVLLTMTRRGLTDEVQQLLAQSGSVLLSIDDELTLQPDGSFKIVRSISEYIASMQYCS